ncbi:MAG: tetratricopeptide repeat protein [Chloroflexi bacterium]|jgi:predicted ATPase/class 3 adenylate cyclase|nr:tetratricopeptide repeat protein [Chloroflexota bacterium]
MGGSDYLLEPLTQRELEILRLRAEGLSNREIAQKLVIAQGTVKSYNKQLYSKLGVHSWSQAEGRARAIGLLADARIALLSGTVTFLFTDIEGSTKLWERHREAMGAALRQHDELLRRTIQEKDGRVFKTVGDAFCAVFDDAVKALSAAYAAQAAILAQDWGKTPIRIRIAVHTGTAELRHDDYFGPSVNHVARLLSAGHGGQILVSASTRALAQRRLPEKLSLRDLGKHHLKDLGRAERIYQLIAPDLPADFPPLNSLGALPENLPEQLTSFVGREREIAEVKRLLATTRLLTLIGPPGTGKTRLGLQVAAELLNHFPDGVYFIELSPIRDPALVANTIAQVFGIREASGQPLLKTLQNYLREKRLLLLIDNFEQVIDAAPLVGELLSDSPGLKALVTSREALRIYGEQEYAVPPLTLPDLEGLEPLSELGQYESVELFCQRAGAVKPDFTLTEENAPFVSEICLRLDGLPLAIELAAARSKLLSPESMCARLESRLLTLTGGPRDLPARMQTLRTAIDWSYNLLDADEQRLFNRLSVFQGGRAIEAVETICDSDLSFAVLDGLESLLNKNLLYSAEGRTGETRFYQLETIHEYAHERLAQNGEADDIKTRHAMYFVALAERAEAELHGARQEYWYARLTDELDNIRTALNWTLDGVDVELGARLVTALRDYWYYSGLLLSECSAWIDRALQTEGKISPAVRARTLNTSSRVTYARGDFAESACLARQALSLACDVNDIETCAWSHLFISVHSMISYDQTKELLTHTKEGLRLFRELDNKEGVATGLNTLGELARLDGDYARSGRFYEECLALSKETGNRVRKAISLANLSYVAYHEGNYDQAIDYGKKALSLLNSLPMEHVSANFLAMIAGPIGARGDPRRAARLLAASEAQLETMGASIQPQDKFEVDEFENAVREQLDETEFDKAWAAGRALTMEQALAEVMVEI